MKFIYSAKMLYILAAALVAVFFLPDIIGPVPAVVVGGCVIAFALYVYNLWSKQNDEETRPRPDDADDGDRQA